MAFHKYQPRAISVDYLTIAGAQPGHTFPETDGHDRSPKDTHIAYPIATCEFKTRATSPLQSGCTNRPAASGSTTISLPTTSEPSLTVSPTAAVLAQAPQLCRPRYDAIGFMPCDGPREIRLTGWLGSTAQISEPSVYVM